MFWQSCGNSPAVLHHEGLAQKAEREEASPHQSQALKHQLRVQQRGWKGTEATVTHR